LSRIRKSDSTRGKGTRDEGKLDWRGKIRDKLLQMRGETLRGISESLRDSDYLAFDVGDFYDHATADRDREIAHTLTERDRERLRLIEDALKRIEEGSYGICDSCGLDIEKDRLLVMPFAKLCLACQEDLERQVE
jgi:DnaK suppressor protein